jgi:hypothetical protein
MLRETKADDLVGASPHEPTGELTGLNYNARAE